MKLAEFSIKHPAIVAMLLIVTLVFGVMAAISLNAEAKRKASRGERRKNGPRCGARRSWILSSESNRAGSKRHMAVASEIPSNAQQEALPWSAP